MADPSVVDMAVSSRLNDVNQIVSTALDQADGFFSTLQVIDNIRPPYLIPGNINYTPPDIQVDVARPEAPDTAAAVQSLQSGTLEPYSPGNLDLKDQDIIPEDTYKLLPASDSLKYTEEAYTSELLTALQTKLQNLVENGGTGLSDSVEQAMQDRQRERDDQAFDDAIDAAKSAWASTGFDLPDNVLAAQVAEINKKRVDMRTDRSREILVDSYKLADQNTRFAIEQGIVMESALMQHFNKVCDRAVEVIFRGATTALEVFRGTIEGYIAEADKKLKETQVLTEQERLRLDEYRANLDKYKTDVEVASVRLDALMKKYGVQGQIYDSDIRKYAATASVQVEQQRIVAMNTLESWKGALEAHRDDVQTYTQLTGIRERAATGGASVLGSYIAAAINSLSAIVHMSSDYTEVN